MVKYVGIIVVIGLIFYFCIKHWSYIIQKSMDYKIYINKKNIYVGDNAILFTEITNRKIIPIPWMKVEIDIPIYFKFNNSKVQQFNEVKNVFKIVTSLLFFEKMKRYDSFKCTKRGTFTIRSAQIDIGDFLGAKRTKFDFKIENELLVYPKIQELNELIEVPKSLQGDLSVRRWIINDPTQVIGVRKYNNNDSFNSIDWKATAKNMELYVKKFDFTSDPSLMIFLDIQTEDIHWRGIDYDRVEYGINIAASIMDQALKDKISVGYTANTTFQNKKNDIFVYPSNSKKQKEYILEALARTTYQRTYTISILINEKIASLGKNCSVILLISYISDELRKTINYYVALGYNIKIILLNNNCKVSGLHKNVEIIYSIGDGRGEPECSIS